MCDVDIILKRLFETGIFGQYEGFILNLLMRGFTVTDIAAILGSPKDRIDDEINNICACIAKELGSDYFS